MKLVYVGDGRNNVANSLLVGGAIVGMDVRICTPESLWPAQEVIDLAKKYNEQVMITSNVEEAVANADVIYTDVWVSMGKKKNLLNVSSY